MPRSVSRSIRSAFIVLTGALLLVAGVQSVAGTEERMGLSTCGWDEKPCVMEELVVKAPDADPDQPEMVAAEVAVPVEHIRAAHALRLPARS